MTTNATQPKQSPEPARKFAFGMRAIKPANTQQDKPASNAVLSVKDAYCTDRATD